MSFFWHRSAPQRTVERYLAATNANDIIAAADLMAEDIRVIDSSGEALEGRTNAVEAMRRLVRMAPDFRIEVSGISSRGSQVLIRGRAICSDERLNGEMLWRAKVDGGHIREWQSFSREGTPHLTRILMPELAGEQPVQYARAG